MTKTPKKTTKKRDGVGGRAYRFSKKERERVEALAGFGVPHRDICLLIRDGISTATLHKYFKAELHRGKAKANAKISQTLFQQAQEGNLSAAIFWAKTQMGWSERHRIEHSTPPKGDGEMRVKLEPADMTDEQLVALIKSAETTEK